MEDKKLDYKEIIKLDKLEIIILLNEKLNIDLDKEINLSKLEGEEFNIAVMHIVDYINNPFVFKNYYDLEFNNLCNYIKENTEDKMVVNMFNNLTIIRRQNPDDYKGFIDYFKRFPLWSTFNPDLGDMTTLKLRAITLKRHLYDFIWLYRRLDDYLSKRTLTAILANWAILDTQYVKIVKSIFPDYFEPDIFPDNIDDVLVDCGAYVGDSIYNYVNAYGTNYKRIYAYEISPDTCIKLQENIDKAKLHDIVIKQKGVGSKKGEFYINDNQDTSANKLGNSGEIKVDVVKIDDDIEEDITFIKMDIEGAEKDALKGCEKTIKRLHPKLAICVYHGYEDIWKIPYMIDKMNPNYKFYLRHNGGDLIPTEFVLLCKDNK